LTTWLDGERQDRRIRDWIDHTTRRGKEAHRTGGLELELITWLEGARVIASVIAAISAEEP
jgi:hypothetical protein